MWQWCNQKRLEIFIEEKNVGLTEKEHKRLWLSQLQLLLLQLLQQRRLRFSIVAVQRFPLAAIAHTRQKHARERERESISGRRLHLMTLRA